MGDRSDRMGMWRVLAAWADDRPSGGSGDQFLDRYVNAFTSVSQRYLLEQIPPEGLPFDLQRHGWLVGRPLTDGARPVVPVATVQLDGTRAAATRCAVRLALLQSREDDAMVHAAGWRFELAEGPGADGQGAAHPYQHAQAITGWSTDSDCLIHTPQNDSDDCKGLEPSGESALDEERAAVTRLVLQSHPAFPLATTSLTGLAAAVVTALYGARAARAVLDRDRMLWQMSNAPRRDLELLLDGGLLVPPQAHKTA